MKNRKTLFWSVFMLLTMIFTPMFGQKGERELKNNDDYLIMVAKVVAKAQQNVEFRNFILKEARKEIGNENVVFMLSSRNKMVSNGRTFADMLSEEAVKLGYKLPQSFFTKDLVQRIPKLTITVYTGWDDQEIDEWKYLKPIKVVPETEAFAGNKEYFETAYDSNLRESKVSNMDDPKEPYLVIEDNSSFVVLRKKDLRTLGGDDLTDVLGVKDICDDLLQEIHEMIVASAHMEPAIFIHGEEVVNPDFETIIISINSLTEMYEEECVIDPPPPPPPPPGMCDRDSRDKREVITKIKVQHSELKTFCRWQKKNCKIEVNQVFAVRDNGNVVTPLVNPKKYIIGRRKKMKKGKTFTCNLKMYKWHYLEGVHGDPYAMTFIGKHHKAGDKRTWSFGLAPKITFKIDSVAVELTGPSAGVKFEHTHKDNPLGGDLIYYCDKANGEGTEYTTGSMTFFVKEDQ